MRILVVDSDPDSSDAVFRRLAASGHEPVRCFAAGERHLCRGVAVGADCPVDSAQVDAAVLIPDPSAPSLRQMGVVCALRHRLPVVAVGDPGTSLRGWVVPAGDDPVAALEHAVSARLIGHQTAVEAALVAVPSVVRNGALPGVVVERRDGGLLLSLAIPGALGDEDVDSVVTWAVRALREHDPHAAVVDVVVDR